MLIFCEKCYRLLGPTASVYEEIYANHPVCLTCRTNDGETFPAGSKGKMLLEMERRTLVIASADERLRWSPFLKSHVE
jgi:hypothetical protein